LGRSGMVEGAGTGQPDRRAGFVAGWTGVGWTGWMIGAGWTAR